MGHAKKRGTYEERVAQSKKGIKSYEQFLEAKEEEEYLAHEQTLADYTESFKEKDGFDEDESTK